MWYAARIPFIGRSSRTSAQVRSGQPPSVEAHVAGPILVTVLGMVAELERSFIRERQKAGIERAKAKRGLQGPQADRGDAQGWGWAERHRERARDQPDECASGAEA